MNYEYKINEIFYSIQGEGRYTGTPAIFIRFSGCNLKCKFCDTDFSNYKIYNKSQLEYEINKISISLKDKPIIVFTGGEPALHLHEDEELLKDYFRTCETNGIIELPTWINWITCSPKTIVNNDYIFNRVKELKFLMIEEKLDYIEEMYQKFKNIIPIYIQPLELQEKMNIKETIDWLLKHPKACLSLQTHKIIGMK